MCKRTAHGKNAIELNQSFEGLCRRDMVPPNKENQSGREV